MKIERRDRSTIMSGRVATFATGFREEPGVFGPHHEPTGPFEVSASRDAVIVHRAEVTTKEEVVALRQALADAWDVHEALKGTICTW